MKRLCAFFLLALSCAASATTFNPIQLLNPAGSVAGQAIVSTGPTTVAAWGGIGLSGISAIAANTVLANATASSASPTAFAMPSCSATGTALNWTTSTGFTCQTGLATLNAPSFTGGVGVAGGLSISTGGASISAGGLSVTGTVSGTGFSNYLASPPAIGGTSPAAGSFTALSATGNFTPSQTNGIVGTTTNNNANAGSVGEVLTNNTSATSMTNNTAANCTSVSLTAGDWDVQGELTAVPAGTTTVQAIEAGITTTSATFPGSFGSAQVFVLPFTTGSTQIISTPVVRESLSATTTVYLVGLTSFGVSTMTCNGFIRARRVR